MVKGQKQGGEDEGPWTSWVPDGMGLEDGGGGTGGSRNGLDQGNYLRYIWKDRDSIDGRRYWELE